MAHTDFKALVEMKGHCNVVKELESVLTYVDCPVPVVLSIQR